MVAYHLAPSHAPGGFVGVDVFFVISGYLMTRIIGGGLEGGGFSLRAFYRARLRRIWPALAALCVGLWVFGALCLDPWTFQRMGGELPFALLFVSNFAFAGHGGYFAESGANNWVLHTWSVAVEWQFYLLYPLLLMALFARPWGRRRLWLILAGLTALSFVVSVALPERNWNLDFYMLPTRAWELLAGALCAGAERRLQLSAGARRLVHVAGLALIGLGVVLARPNVGWPSFVTLAPVGGAALVILANLRSRWAANPVVDFIGRTSYSIYIWHWPVVVWIGGLGEPLTLPVAIAAVAGMIALGAASYWLIERRLTAWLFQPRPWRWALGGAVALAVIPLSVVAADTRGLEVLRTLGAPPEVQAALADARRADRDWAYPQVCGSYTTAPIALCRIGDPAARQVLVIGDSHAEQVAPRYVRAFEGRSGQGLTFSTIRGCIPIPHVSSRGSPRCGQGWTAIYRYAETAGFRRIVIIAAWDRYFDKTTSTPHGVTMLDPQFGAATRPTSTGALASVEFAALARAVRRLQATGAQVVLVGAAPEAGKAAPHWLYHQVFWTHQLIAPPVSRARFERRAELVRGLLSQVSRDTGAPLVEPLDGVCRQDQCQVMDGARTLYKDFGHYRASMMTLPVFAFLDPWLGPQPAAAPRRLK